MSFLNSIRSEYASMSRGRLMFHSSIFGMLFLVTVLAPIVGFTAMGMLFFYVFLILPLAIDIVVDRNEV